MRVALEQIKETYVGGHSGVLALLGLSQYSPHEIILTFKFPDLIIRAFPMILQYSEGACDLLPSRLYSHL